MTRVLRCLLIAVSLATVMIAVCGVSAADAHRDGCHAQHSCPSDSGTYVCGDTGNYSECPGMAGTISTSSSSPSVGSTLSGLVTWTASPTSATYQWTRAGQPIQGATTTAYTVTVDDLGQTLALTATATDGRQQTAASSSPPVNVPPLSGQAALAQTIATFGTVLEARASWNAPVREAYQSLRGGVPIVGATANTYQVTQSDLGQPIAAVVAGAAGSSQAATQTGPLTPTAAVKLKLNTPKTKVRKGRTVSVAGVARSVAPVGGLKVAVKITRRARGRTEAVLERSVTIRADGTFGQKVRAGRGQAGRWTARAVLSSPPGYSPASATRKFLVG